MVALSAISSTAMQRLSLISYSPLYRNGLDLHILEVPYDEEFMKNLMERIDLAVGYMKEQIEQLDKVR